MLVNNKALLFMPPFIVKNVVFIKKIQKVIYSEK